jgi:exonuclease SbcC
MRPNLLEISGFTAFREPVTVDFRGADLFALTGPTGSGKSSLIDAIVFSLYGSVPRIGQREVAPIVSLGKLEARIRFEFSLDDVDYTVARVVRRTKSGASTVEARLERDGEVLAGTADEVTERVGNLLGLGFEHFTKSVVLPQGQFATFLHDRPADRQKLLRELLDLGIYEHMRDLAKQRRLAAEARLQVLRTQIDELAYATPEVERQAGERLLRLQSLREEVEETGPRLQTLRDQIESLTEVVARAGESVNQLRRVKMPDGIGALAARLIEARRTAVEAEQAAAMVGDRLQKAKETRRTLPAGADIEQLIGRHRALVAEEQTVAGVKDDLAGAKESAQDAFGVLEGAAGAVEATRRDVEAANRKHAAHALAVTLVAGEECPVCRQTVQDPPLGEAPPALARAEAALAKAIQAEEEARQTEGATGKQLAAQEARLGDLTTRIANLQKDLIDAPSLDRALATKTEIAAAESKLKATRAEADQTAAGAQSARRAIEALEAETAEARRQFDKTRDLVASLEPPVPERVDLAADWAQLTEWAVAETGRLTKQSSTSEKNIKELQTDLATQSGALEIRVEQEGIEVADRSLRDVVVDACTAATHELTRIQEAVKRVTEHREHVKVSTEEAELAKSLGQHLSATGFEAWLMEEALGTLVTGANLLLGDLADEAYSLEVVNRDFRVIDHRNANEPRAVKTLSGGETFLVSLALALSLAEQLASMSVHGGGRLESVFLDEGFGTLDVETLDTVAHVIQELGARGRTVGIVTHVRDLAEQVPVRFEVHKGPGTATVERVEL